MIGQKLNEQTEKVFFLIFGIDAWHLNVDAFIWKEKFYLQTMKIVTHLARTRTIISIYIGMSSFLSLVCILFPFFLNQL